MIRKAYSVQNVEVLRRVIYYLSQQRKLFSTVIDLYDKEAVSELDVESLNSLVSSLKAVETLSNSFIKKKCANSHYIHSLVQIVRPKNNQLLYDSVNLIKSKMSYDSGVDDELVDGEYDDEVEIINEAEKTSEQLQPEEDKEVKDAQSDEVEEEEEENAQSDEVEEEEEENAQSDEVEEEEGENAQSPPESSDPIPAPSSDPIPAPSSDPIPAPSSDPIPVPSSDPVNPNQPMPPSDPVQESQPESNSFKFISSPLLIMAAIFFVLIN